MPGGRPRAAGVLEGKGKWLTAAQPRPQPPTAAPPAPFLLLLLLSLSSSLSFPPLSGRAPSGSRWRAGGCPPAPLGSPRAWLGSAANAITEVE